MGSTTGAPGAPLATAAFAAGSGFERAAGFHVPGREHGDSAQSDERYLGHAGNHGEGEQDSADNPQRARGSEHLLADVCAQGEVRAGAGDDDAAGY